VFFSAGDEWYWEKKHGRQNGDFSHEYLPGFRITPWVRVTPTLVPIIWRYDGDVILKCINGRFALPVTLLLAKLRRKRLVLWTGMWRHPRTLFHALTYPVTRLVYRWSDAIVVYGDHVKRYLTSLGVSADKIFVAPHAVDNEAYSRHVNEGERRDIRARYGLGERRLVLFVGRLAPVKGLEILLEAYARLSLPNVALVLVGDGELRPRLERLAGRLGISDRVTFAGYISPADTVSFYATADVLVLPSVSVRAGRETWGLVVNEAMNQGTPVVATTAVGAAAGGLVQPGRTGEVVPEGQPGPLAEALLRILSDGPYREHLRAGAREVIAGWNNDRMVEGFLSAARYAAARKRRR